MCGHHTVNAVVRCMITLWLWRVPHAVSHPSSMTQSSTTVPRVHAAVFSIYYMLLVQSFLFKSASSAQNMALFVNFTTGLALMVTSFVLNLVEGTRDVNAKLKWIYRLFPG